MTSVDHVRSCNRHPSQPEAWLQQCTCPPVGSESKDSKDPDRPLPLVRRLSDVLPERLDWLWPGYLALGKLHVLDGDPGLGKSTMTLDLGARVSTGESWPDGGLGCTPGGVLLVSAEDGLADTIRPRLDAAGADTEKVLALTGVRASGGDRMPALPIDVELLGDLIGEHGIRFVVIDPLMAYLGSDVNSHRDQDVRRALAPLARLGEVHSAAILLVRHLNKGAGSALYRGGGSIGIVGAARFGYMVARDPEDERRRVLASTKANLAVQPPALGFELVDKDGYARIEWHGAVSHSADDLVRPEDEDSDDRNDAAAWLRSYLADNGGEAEAEAVLKAGVKVGFTKDTLKRSKKRAHCVSRKEAMDAGWMWVLKPEGSTKGAKGAGT